MKTIILLLLTISLYSQNKNTFVRIQRFTPDSVCYGSQAKVNFTFDTTTAGQYQGKTTFRLTGINQAYTIWEGHYKDFYAWPTEIIFGKKTRIIQFFIPDYYYDGPLFIEVDGDSKYTNYKHCDPTPTGIHEYIPNTITPTYYDLQGNKVERHTNELIIEQRGNTRHKVFIQE